MTDQRGDRDAILQGFSVPVDVQLGLGALTLLWLVTLLPIASETPVRIGVTLVFSLFIPGYGLIAVLFPERGDVVIPKTETSATNSDGDTGIDTLERIVLSFGASIAIVPLVGLILNFTPWGLRLVPILIGLTLVTGPLLGLATARRTRLPPDQRFDPQPRRWLAHTWADLQNPVDRVDLVLNVLLVLSIALAAGSVAYAATDAGPEEEFTEFYLLTENESGELYAGDYPTNLTTGEQYPLVIGLTNQEGQSMTYTVVTELQRVRINGNETAVMEQVELAEFTWEIDANETSHVTRTVTPRDLTGERLRLQFRLFRDTQSVDGSRTAYRETHLWISVK
ncbi:DUF1616 domain-containing protein [Haloarcula sp. JP-L23]|uniref:DUF1616 domain-containing protein n=1 Tax=Haloarcula sp. JP-L23 TaxID=2716717 RepID=UPI00140F0ED9|nr:DUF1616 domain-containing protein [Haloarcula sp. JP-L23]